MEEELYDEAETIKSANNVEDFISCCKLSNSILGKIAKEDEEPIKFNCRSINAINIPLTLKEAIYDIFQQNMKEIYIKSNWNYSPEEKSKELFHRRSKFLLVWKPNVNTDTNSSTFTDTLQLPMSENLVGYVMFRFEWDDEEEPEYPVLYCYELQIRQEFQNQSIGQRLLQMLVEIARSMNMRKIMLTSLKINERAMRFYFQNGFKIDRNSPSRFGITTEPHEILSHNLRNRIV